MPIKIYTYKYRSTVAKLQWDFDFSVLALKTQRRKRNVWKLKPLYTPMYV